MLPAHLFAFFPPQVFPLLEFLGTRELYDAADIEKAKLQVGGGGWGAVLPLVGVVDAFAAKSPHSCRSHGQPGMYASLALHADAPAAQVA